MHMHTYLHEHLRCRRRPHRDHHAPPDLKLRDEVDGNPLGRRPNVDGVVRPVLRPPVPPVPGLVRFRFVLFRFDWCMVYIPHTATGGAEGASVLVSCGKERKQSINTYYIRSLGSGERPNCTAVSGRQQPTKLTVGQSTGLVG